MKKIALGVVAAMMLCSLCIYIFQPKESEYVKLAKEYGYAHVNGISYGMSIDECIKALKLDKDKVEIVEVAIPESFDDVNKNYNGIQKKQGFSIESEFLGRKATMVFLFVPSPLLYTDLSAVPENVPQENMNLQLMRILIEGVFMPEEIVAEFEAKLEADGLLQAYSKHEQGFLWGDGFSNVNTLEQIKDEQIKEKVLTLYSERFFPSSVEKTDANIATMRENIKSEPLDKIMLLPFWSDDNRPFTPNSPPFFPVVGETEVKIIIDFVGNYAMMIPLAVAELEAQKNGV